MADFGNSRELSLRWMLYLAEEAGPLRWIQALGKHIHHAGVCVILVYILTFGIDSNLRPIADKALLADYVVAFCHLCVMLRFERVGRWLKYVPAILAPIVAVAFVLPIASGSVASPVEVGFRALIGFSFTGTLICNLLGAVGGGYVRSRRRVEVNVRGIIKRRSLGGLAFEHLIASINDKSSYDCENACGSKCPSTWEDSSVSSANASTVDTARAV